MTAGAVEAQEDAVVRLLSCTDAENLVAAAARAATPPDAPRVAALYRLHHHGRLQLAAAVGLSEEALRAYQVMTADADLPAAQAVRERRPVYSAAMDFPRSSLKEASGDQFPPIGLRDEFVALPLVADGDCLGVLTILLPSGAELHGAVSRRLHAVATTCAHRWQRLLAAPLVPVPPLEERIAATSRTPAPLASGRGRVAMLELAMSNAGIGSFDYDFRSGRLVWDERTCELFGIRPEDFDGRVETLFNAIHPDDRGSVRDAVEDSLGTGRFHTTHRIRHTDGTIRWIEAESRIVYDHEGEPQGMIGVAKDRTDERQRERARQARKDFILNLTRGLSAALSIEEIVHVLIDTALPVLGGSALAVYLWEGQGQLRLVGSEGFDTDAENRMRAVSEAAAGGPETSFLEEGSAVFIESRQQYREAVRGAAITPQADQHSWAIIPLTSAEGLVGVCVVAYDHPRSFTPDDRTVFTAAGGILGQSLSRARLFDTRRGYLTDLQQLMLPSHLPHAPALEIAVAYQPGSEGLEVGGDWYDVVPRAEGRTALVIGDVQGHSARAASVMGPLRISMRTYAAESHGPASLLDVGNQAMHEMATGLFATCCVAEIEPHSGTVHIVRAGHPYPLLLDPHGRVRELEVPGGVPLGTGLAEEYPVTVTELSPGSTLLLYTDGLVERSGISYEQGVHELCERFAWWAGGQVRDTASRLDEAPDLEAAAQGIAAPAASRSLHDDIAVLLVRPA